jgi:hypothetical protein
MMLLAMVPRIWEPRSARPLTLMPERLLDSVLLATVNVACALVPLPLTTIPPAPPTFPFCPDTTLLRIRVFMKPSPYW